MRSWLRAPVTLAAVACTAVLLARAPNLRAARQAAAVATENATATREALSVLRMGGSAADAAITAALVAGVTSPSSSGLGGGGFALVYDQSNRSLRAFDFRERAPRGLNPEPFERRPLSSAERGVLVGVPGEWAGLTALHREFGRLPLSVLVGRAAARARQGFFVSPHLAAALNFSREKLEKSPALMALYFPRGKALATGQRLVNPRLGETLEKLQAGGPRALYEGSLAEGIVAAAAAHGSPMTLSDLEEYEVIERKPLCRPYAGDQVCTMPAPSAGGLLLLEVLGLFSPDRLRALGHGSTAYQHLLAEGMRGALADRMRYYGDPAFETFDEQALLSEAWLGPRRAQVSLERTHTLPRFQQEEHGTHHLVVRDRQGNLVSLTTTVNRAFGAAVVDEASGIVLNDQLDDFTASASVAQLGLTQSPNRPRPLARPVSSMTPTIVLRGEEAVLGLGGSGGLAIGINVTQVLLEALVFDHSPRLAVSAPRIFVPFQGSTLLVEGELSEERRSNFRFRGELVAAMPRSTGAVQVVRVRDGEVSAASDPRKFGEAVVEP